MVAAAASRKVSRWEKKENSRKTEGGKQEFETLGWQNGDKQVGNKNQFTSCASSQAVESPVNFVLPLLVKSLTYGP